MDGTLPEIEESKARGEIARLYHDIRQTMNVPKVNLIYRYFATIDGGLTAIWPSLKAHFQSGAFAQIAGDCRAMYRSDDKCERLISTDCLDPQTRQQIAEILDFYLIANPLNLCALEFLAANLEVSVNIEGTLSPLVSLADLRKRIETEKFPAPADELMFLVSQGVASVRPTLLRELQNWPDFIQATSAYMKTCCLDEQFAAHVSSIRYKVKTQAISLVQEKPISMPTAAARQIAEFCAYFPVILIRMTLIANALRRAVSQ